MARAQLAVLRRKKTPKDVVLPPQSKTNIDKLGIGSSSRSSRKGIGYVLSNGFQQGGLRGLYRGITPTVLGILPYSGAAFTINEQAKLKISRVMQREPTTIERLQCGALSGLFAQTLTYPLEVTRRRMQTIGIVPTSGSESAAVNFTGVSQLKPSVDELPLAQQQQPQPQGGLRGLYRGITPTVLGILPYSGAAFTINEQAKLKISRVMQREPTTIERLQCGALSGLFAQTLTYPLEVTRRRMQTIGIVPTSGSESAAVNFTGVSQLKPSVDELPLAQQQQPQPQKPITSSQTTTTETAATSSPKKSTHKPPSMMKTMSHLLEEQGIRGFFKGVSMNWVKGPIAFSISFTAFDTIQGWIETESEKEKRRFSIQRRMTNTMERRITNHEDGD